MKAFAATALFRGPMVAHESECRIGSDAIAARLPYRVEWFRGGKGA
jgi:hypothetical protein